MKELEWERKMLMNVPRVFSENEFYGVINQHGTNELINHSLGIVITTISTNYGYYHDLDELYGIGVNALLDVVRDYTYEKGPYIHFLKDELKKYLDSYILGETTKESYDELVEEGYPSDDLVVDDEEILNQELLKEELLDILDTLTLKQELVIRRFFGIGCEKKTYEQIAEELGITVNQVRTIKDNAIKRLRHPINSRKLKDYADYKVYSVGGHHE